MKKQVLKSEFTFSGFLFSVGLTYVCLIFGNFLYEVCLFYFYPGSQIYTDPEFAESIIEAADQAKNETIQVVKHRPIELLVVSTILGVLTFIILYGPWEQLLKKSH